MAGEWIKMRCNLSTDPDVIAIAEATKCDEDTVVGKLHRLWSWADSHTVDGHVIGISASWIDRFVQVPGFAHAMAGRNWLLIEEAGVTFANFDRHNGQTAKLRAENLSRQQRSRSTKQGTDRDTLRDKSATKARQLRDKSVTEARQTCDNSVTEARQKRDLEKRREEKNNLNLIAADAAGTSGDELPPKTPHATVVDHWMTSWSAAHDGERYPFSGKDGNHVKAILKHVDAERAKRVIDRYLADTGTFVTEDRHGLGLLVSQLRRYVVDKPVQQATGVKTAKMSKPGEFTKQTYSPG